MTGKRFYLIATIILTGLLVLACGNPELFQPRDSFGAALDTSPEATWLPVIQYDWNGYFSWRADPWVLALSEIIAPENSPIKYHVALLFVLVLGGALYLKAATRTALHDAIAASTLGGLICALVLGADTVTLSILAWAPFLAIALIAMQRTGELFTLIAVLLFAVRTVATANHATALSFAVGVGLALLPPRDDLPAGPDSAKTPRHGLLPLLAAVIITGAYLLFLQSVQHAPFPSYPANGHLVPDDGLPGFIRPLIGPGPSLPTVAQTAVAELSKIPGLIIAILGSLCAVFAKRHDSTTTYRASVVAALLGLSIIWDSSLDQSIAQIGPLAAISRMVPNLFLFPLAPVAIGIGILLITLSWSALFNQRNMVPKVFIVVAVMTILSQLFPQIGRIIPAPSINNGSTEFTKDDILPPEWISKASFTPGSEPIDWDRALRSPSRYVARFFGRGPLAISYSSTFTTSTPIGSRLKKVWATQNQELLPFLNDGKLDTRYTTGGGAQTGKESVVLWFTEPINLLGISLSTGRFVTDFPRGVEIRGLVNCPENFESFANAQVLARFDSWQGAPKRTAEERLPYFGGQEDVKVPFNAPIAAACLFIKQTGTVEHFDWSIAEIGLLEVPH